MTQVKQTFMKATATITVENPTKRVTIWLHGPVSDERYAQEYKVATHRLDQMTPPPQKKGES